ncbi:MAG: hypothetical protein M3Y64_11010, partial [Gemmatimonadota bacterium]|nr:hypothetical protein [Gemmatimonadota bacterium]
MQLDSKERLAAGWMDVGNAANALDRVRGGERARRATDVAVGEADAASKRGWVQGAVRFAVNAAIGLLLMTAVPISVAAWRQNHSQVYANDLSARIAEVEPVRALMSPKDARITPTQAGVAFRALQLQTAVKNVASPARTVAVNNDRPWKTYKLTDEMFPGRSALFNGPPSPAVITMAVHGFSKKELTYLQMVADAPVWRDFDIVGNAAAVDIVAGYYTLPLGANASLSDMPLFKFADTKELAYAGVSRAAYYLAIGKPDEAQAALRSIISFGFALLDNGTSDLDALMGRVILGIGRDALSQFYAATGQPIPLAQQAGFQLFKKNLVGRRPERVAQDVMRQRWIEEAGNPALPRALRLERLRQLSYSSCGNVREMLFGPDANIREAFSRASTTLARFPAQQAYLELLLNT